MLINQTRIKVLTKAGLLLFLCTSFILVAGCGTDDKVISDDSIVLNENESINTLNEGIEVEDSIDEELETENNESLQPKIDFLTNWKIPSNFMSMAELFSSIHYQWYNGSTIHDAQINFTKDNGGTLAKVALEQEGMVMEVILMFDPQDIPQKAEISLHEKNSEALGGSVKYADPETVQRFIIDDKLYELFIPFRNLLSGNEYMDEAIMGEGDYGIEVIPENGPIEDTLGKTYSMRLKYDGVREDQVKFTDFGDFQLLTYRKTVNPSAGIVDENGVAYLFEILDVVPAGDSIDVSSSSGINLLPEGWPEEILPIIEGSEIDTSSSHPKALVIEAYSDKNFDEVYHFYKEVMAKLKDFAEFDMSDSKGQKKSMIGKYNQGTVSIGIDSDSNKVHYKILFKK